jgi:hypothetical protein
MTESTNKPINQQNNLTTIMPHYTLYNLLTQIQNESRKLIPKEEEVLSLNFQSEGNLRRVTQQTSKESKNKCNVSIQSLKVK